MSDAASIILAHNRGEAVAPPAEHEAEGLLALAQRHQLDAHMGMRLRSEKPADWPPALAEALRAHTATPICW